MVYEVIIAGGGPVGLFLACELRLAGVPVLVLEQMEDHRTPLKAGLMGARGLNFPSVEAFYRRGLLKAVRESALAWMVADDKTDKALKSTDETKPAAAPRFAGHFAGILLDGTKIDFSNRRYFIQGPAASGGMVSLEGIEELLAERAEALGVAVRRGMAVTDLTQHDDGVSVQTAGETLQAKWLVGCDGGRSVVRKRAGFDFAGTDPELTGTIAVADFADPEKLLPGWNLTPTGMYVNGPVPGRISVVEFDGASADRDSPVTLEAMQKSLRHVSGTDVTVTALHLATRYTDNARQATTYCQGRVLLAGDAAHVHSPFGGQGLNLGIGDAMNLGWKLAATIKGWAPEGLLDTYTEERHPIGAWALNWTRAQVAIMRPEPHARAMAQIVRDLLNTREATTYFAERIAGLWQRYSFPGSDHPLTGCSAPDFEFEDGTRLGALLHDGRALLVDLGGNQQLRGLSEFWPGRLKYLSAKAKDTLGLTALVVRPDGFVAWAVEGEPDPTRAAEVLRHWLGSEA
jgi:2-polyprenyl-6-methoxyphenol hydroxylase-like FAD-dependent oxidoreductase